MMTAMDAIGDLRAATTTAQRDVVVLEQAHLPMWAEFYRYAKDLDVNTLDPERLAAESALSATPSYPEDHKQWHCLNWLDQHEPGLEWFMMHGDTRLLDSTDIDIFTACTQWSLITISRYEPSWRIWSEQNYPEHVNLFSRGLGLLEDYNTKGFWSTYKALDEFGGVLDKHIWGSYRFESGHGPSRNGGIHGMIKETHPDWGSMDGPQPGIADAVIAMNMLSALHAALQVMRFRFHTFALSINALESSINPDRDKWVDDISIEFKAYVIREVVSKRLMKSDHIGATR